MWRRRLCALLPRSPSSSSSTASSSCQRRRHHLLPGEEPHALNHLARLFTSKVGSDGGDFQKPFIAFVLGGPGSGKGTQCTKIASDFGFAHLSAGDLLRHEISSCSEKGELILEIIKEGRIVPSEITVELIRKAMEMSNARKVLIDGFPRCEENRIAFERIIGTEPDIVLFFDCPEDEMVKRLLGRNQGRVDDNIETIKKRLKVFESLNIPVIDYYSSRGKVHKINATGTAEEIFEGVRKLFSSLSPPALPVRPRRGGGAWAGAARCTPEANGGWGGIVEDDLSELLQILPRDLQDNLQNEPRKDRLLEVILDLGRRPEARFLGDSGGQYLRDSEISQQELEYAQRAVGEFGGDNRAGIEGTLHRISAIRSRKGMVVGLTCRVGRAVTGHVDMVRDLLNYKESILFLGRPGVGKTTVMREIARVLADEFQKRVVIVDTSNEIGGDGDIPHSAIGGARRMQVPEPSMQHRVMIEAVENHMPEVVIVDEIGTEAEAQACRSIAERGVMLIGTAHGERLANIIKNPTLSDLIGGVETVTLGDDEARARRSQKSILERKAPPTFPFLIEMRERHYWVTHRTERSVDMLLHGKKPLVEVRKRDNKFQVVIERWATYDGDGL